MKSSINVSIKSYVNFKGRGVVFFEDSGISLIGFSEKSYMNERGENEGNPL